MTKDKVKDDRNTKSKKNDASPASISGSADASGIRRAGRETPSRKQATASLSNTRKSERIEKQTSPSPSPTKKKPERIEKPMGPSPLRRSDRSKKHISPDSSGSKNLVEVPASSNIKSLTERIASSSKHTEGDVGEDKKNDRHVPDVGGKKRKRMTAREYKALFKPQRIRIIEADDDKDPEGPSSNQRMSDVDKELKSPDKLPQLDNNKSGCSLEDRDDGCKNHDYDETCLACPKVQSINHDLDNQEGLGSCDKTCNRDLCGNFSPKVGETCEAGGVMENAENNDAATPLRKETSSLHDRESNGTICTSCKLGGQLRVCDAVGCNRCYHVSCLDPPVDNLPLGIWHCPVCVNNIKSSVHSVSRVAESIWDTREVELSDAKGSQRQKQYFIKYNDLSHIHNEWVTEAQLLIEAPQLVETFNKDPTVKWNKAWTVPHQLLKKRLLLSFLPLNEGQENSCKVLNYHYEWLVKWQDLDYGEATWELESSSVMGSPKGQNLVKEYENCHGKTGISASTVDKTMDPSVMHPTIPAGGPHWMDQIHLSYVKKLHDSWITGQNRVVFDFDNQDRMRRVVLFILSLKGVVTQPLLIITTPGSLSQWEAMFLHVAPSNDFKVSIETHTTSVRLLGAHKEGGQLVFQVLLYPVDVFAEDLNMLRNINWEAIMVDESQCSEISTHFNDIKSVSADRRFLLFGGQLGENMSEYLNVLSQLGCNVALSDDSLGKLKETLSRYFIAYECKSDSSKFLEFWVPVLISNVQLEQYCATLLSNALALRSCKKSDTVGAAIDILISNRKCCNHPYLVDHELQGKITKGLEPTMIWDVGIKASGKLQFLDSILPEIKKRQLRVVILFQPTGGSGRGSASVGDILDDFVLQRFGQESYERVDGIGIVPAKKQAALNSFNKNMSRFIFLLEHRACLPNIKLSSVDIIVIFDSDFNPANDLRALQKISIDSKSEQIMTFRLYSKCTLEEKILRLAEQNVAIESKLQRSTCDALLMWGASDLFNKLSEFHSASSVDISSQESFLKDVVEEFIYLISHKCKSKDTAKSIITRVQSCGNFGKKNIPLLGETKTQLLPDGEQPHVFWRKLLEGWYPQWKFVSVSTPRQRKRPNLFVYSSKETTVADPNVAKKRKKTVNNNIEPPAVASKSLTQGETGGTNEGASGVPSHNESQSSSGDHFWSAAVRNEMSLHNLLKPTVSELCKVLNFSVDAKIIVERFLEFVLENYHVSKEHTSALQAFMISLCWIGSSLSKFKMDRKESFALAKKHLNFSCMEEEANSAYLKLEPAKDTFLRYTQNQEKLNDCIPAPQATCTESTEPRMSHSLPPNPQGVNVKQELAKKDLKDIEKFKREWEDKRVHLENDYQVDKALIRTLHGNPSVRSEKLKSLDKEFANKLEEHERMKEIHLKDLEAMISAGERQMAANSNSSFNGSQHETQMVHSGDSKQGAQDIPDVTLTSFGNLIKVPSHDKPVHDMHPVLPDDINAAIPNMTIGGSIRTQTSTSLENPKVGAMIQDQPKQGGSSGISINNVEANGMLTMEPPARAGNSCEDANDIESTGSHTSEKQMADATVSSVPIGEIPAQQHDGIHNNVAGADATMSSVPIEEIPEQQHEGFKDNMAGPVASVKLGVPEADSNRENAKGGTTSPGRSCALEDRNETGPSDMALHVESAEMGMPAGSCNKENAEDGTISPGTSHAVEDQNDSCGSSSSNSPSTVGSQEKMHSVQLFASPASDHSMPTIPEIQNESLQLQQLPHGRIQDKAGQADPSSLPEIDIDNLQPVDAGQAGQINSKYSSLDPHDESSFQLPTNPPIFEDQSDILPASGLLLETTCEELDLTCFPGGPSQSVENQANPSDHTMLQSGRNLEEHPLVAAETPLGEHSPHLPSSDAVHDQSSVELHNSAQNPEVPVPPHTAEIPNQNTSRPELNLADPLQAEMERLCAAKDHAIRSHEDIKQRLKSECENEIAEMIAQIKLKYEAKRQDAEVALHLKKKELDMNLNRVVMNKILAAAFRSKCHDLAPGHAGQVSQAGLMQQLHKFSGMPSMRRSVGNASSSPCQTSGSQQTTLPPPLQIVHQPAALFSNTQSRLPPPSTNVRPPSSAPTRQTPSINPITMSAANLRVNTETRAHAPHIRSLINNEIRAPAPHMRPSGGSELRAPAPHMRPSGNSEIRAPAPHIRPFRSPASGSPDFATYRSRRVPPPQQVTSSLPLISPSNSQALPVSTSSAPLPPEASTVLPASAHIRPSASPWLPSRSQSPQPSPPQAPPQSTGPLLAHYPSLTSQQHPASSLPATTSSLPHSSSHAPLTRIPTSQTGVFSASPRPESGGPSLPSHRHNILQPLSEIRSMIDSLNLTDFIREGNARSSSGHDLVCLSDDD